MRPAPPLALVCPPSRAWRALCAALGALAGACAAGWAAGHLELATPGVTLALVAGTLAGLAYGLVVAGPAQSVELAWDGGAWLTNGHRGRLQVMLDLDRWLLLRWRAADRARRPRVRWLMVGGSAPRAEGIGDLHALRAALYSRPPEATPEPPHVRAPDRVDH